MGYILTGAIMPASASVLQHFLSSQARSAKVLKFRQRQRQKIMVLWCTVTCRLGIYGVFIKGYIGNGKENGSYYSTSNLQS